MTSSTDSGLAEDVPSPDAAPAPKTVFGACLARVANFGQYARIHSSSDLIFHRATADGDLVQLFGVDLNVVLQAAGAWMELMPLLDGGLAEGSRIALDRIGAYGEKFDAARRDGRWHRGAVVSSIDDAVLDFTDVAHVAFLLDFVDQVAKRNQITAAPPAPSAFNDAMLDRIEIIYREMPDADLEAYVKRARLIWPEITSGVVTEALSALALRASFNAPQVTESAS